MSEQPRASVIVPHLNEPDNLRQCLLALESQRAHDIAFEIIVVDNGSAEIPTFVHGVVPGVRLLHQPVAGPGPARNLAASWARAPLLAFIDADCLAAPDWLSVIVRSFEARPDLDFAGGDIRIRPADAQKLTMIEAYESVYSYRAQRYIEKFGFAATGNMAVRREVFGKVGPFGGIGTMEDTEWGRRASGLGFRSAYLPDAKVYTPSCRSFEELALRWDRHIAHELGEIKGRRLWALTWVGKSVVLAASPPLEAIRVFRSDRLTRLRERLLALLGVTRVRLYRARRMCSLLGHPNPSGMLEQWNRGKG